MESHLFDGLFAQISRPVCGVVKAVLPKDHPQNTVGAFTLYIVEIYPQAPLCMSLELRPCPFLGSLAGHGIEVEIPLLVGQSVVVDFLDGDTERPFVVGAYPEIEPDAPGIAESVEEHPKVSIRANGTTITIKKNGDLLVTLADGKAIQFQDHTGAALASVGSGALAVAAPLKALLTEVLLDTLKAQFDSHTHPTPAGLSSPPSLGLTGLDSAKTAKLRGQ